MGKKKSACQTAPDDESGVKSSPGVQFQTATRHNSTPRITFWTKEATLKPSSGMRFYAEDSCHSPSFLPTTRALSSRSLFSTNCLAFATLHLFGRTHVLLKRDSSAIPAGTLRDFHRFLSVPSFWFNCGSNFFFSQTLGICDTSAQSQYFMHLATQRLSLSFKALLFIYYPCHLASWKS